MRVNIEQMETFICERIPVEHATRIELANGGRANLFPIWDDFQGWELRIVTNDPERAGVWQIYEHFRRQEVTCTEMRKEIGCDMAQSKVQELDNTSAIALSPLDENGLPREVSTAEAAEILGVSKDTVLKLKAAGLLEYRNLAPPSSVRGVFRFSLASVLELRSTYQTDFPTPPILPQPLRRRVRQKEEPKYKHLRVD